MIASRKMKEGYLFLSDEPLVEGPLSTSAPICLGCSSPLREEDDGELYTCSMCSWPLCSFECSMSYVHQKECSILARDTNKIGVPYTIDETPRYDIIFVLRCLLLRTLNPDFWNVLLSMASHAKTWEKSKESHHNATVRYLSEVCKIDYDIDTLHQVRGAIVTNGIEIRSSKGSKIRALYPRIRLLNHSCIPNVHLSCTKQGIMEARAAVNIENGEILYICYTGTTEPLWSRQACCRSIYNFECGCERCKDPTELGTYFSSPKCPCCPGRYLLPKSTRPKSRWQCIRCEMEYEMDDVKQEVEEWSSRLEMNELFGTNSPKHVLSAIIKTEDAFHSKHFMVLQICHKALGVLSKNASLEGLKTRKLIWQKVLEIYNIIEPGLTRRRGENISIFRWCKT